MEGHAHGDGNCTCDPGTHHVQEPNGLVQDSIQIYNEQGFGSQAKSYYFSTTSCKLDIANILDLKISLSLNL